MSAEDAVSPQQFPKRAHLPGIGHVRILHYHGDGRFMVLDRYDAQRLVHRDRLTFLPDPKKES